MSLFLIKLLLTISMVRYISNLYTYIYMSSWFDLFVCLFFGVCGFRERTSHHGLEYKIKGSIRNCQGTCLFAWRLSVFFVNLVYFSFNFFFWLKPLLFHKYFWFHYSNVFTPIVCCTKLLDFCHMVLRWYFDGIDSFMLLCDIYLLDWCNASV